MASQPSRTAKRPVDAVLRLERIRRLLEDNKAEHVVVYDVRPLVDFLDYAVLCTAQSESHARALLRHLEVGLADLGEKPVHSARRSEKADWLAADFGDMAVHIMRDEMRLRYALDERYRGAPVVPATAPG